MNGLNKYYSRITEYLQKNFFSNEYFIIGFLIFLKIIFQLIVSVSGYRWLSADDYCRTVKSYEWLQKPEISSGVWLTPQFWLNGFFMIFIKNLFISATIVNLIFSTVTLVYFYKLAEICFDKTNAFLSSLIYIFFPFQVWLGISGLPESVFFFFVIAGIYYFIRWKMDSNKTACLVLSSVSFAFSNMFRYEGWLFCIVLFLLVSYEMLKNRYDKKIILKNLLITLISFSTIIWWLIQNYVDHRDILFFARETTKIYDTLNTANIVQRIIQYPTFILYIAPVTTFFSLKVIFDFIRNGNSIVRIFILFNILELIILITEATLGTGGTNMISRYVVINAMLLIPLSVYQILKFKKFRAAALITVIILINIIWSFYYPQPFREDTFEVGYSLNTQFKKKVMEPDEKIYFEEVYGYYDVFAVQALSNEPSRFVLGNLPFATMTDKKSRKKKESAEDLNILDIKNFFKKNKIAIAVVKSENYTEKLKRISRKSEEIGDYKLFYLKDFGNPISDSSVTAFSKYLFSLKDNQDAINFHKLFVIKDISVDNTNFGMNPQTVTIDWKMTDKDILDSIAYEDYGFDRYQAILDIKIPNSDSIIHTETKKIFSERNIEGLFENNNVRTIIVIKPFALLYYSRRFSSSPFESGVYTLQLKLRDNKFKRDLILYKGDSLYRESQNIQAEKSSVRSDTLKTKTRNPVNAADSIMYAYNIGNIVAMFPETDYNKLAKKSSSDIFRIILQNSLKLFFSQRYQGDQFLNWMFSYF